MSDRKLASVIQVAGGKRYKLVVLKVIVRDDDGSPRAFELLRDDESTKVEGGEHFWTCYVPEKLLARKD